MIRTVDAVSKAFGQLGDPPFLRVIGGSVLLGIVSFAATWVGAGWLLHSLALFGSESLDTLLAWLGVLATLILTWFLFPMVVIAFVGLFLENIARAVEAKHYPHLAKAPGISFWQGLGATLRFLGVVIAVNVLLLVLLLFPPAYPIGYLLANGYLIGREYFDLVALRRLSPDAARQLRARNTGEMMLLGVGTAFLLTIPVLNLIAPVVATAAMVHRFEAWRGLPPPGTIATPPPPPPPPGFGQRS
ncbi:MAG: EI24 domain-containing protein [Planctomycetes bacterium]|nr:EI24 domain-containing protein [Planctomycetota bacterium]